MADRKNYPELDLLRAAAAMSVMVGHVRNLFFCDHQQLVRPHWIIEPVYFLTGFGHQAVMIFFVLSGLLVGGKTIATVQKGAWSWERYLIERCSRLCIVLWPALLLTLVWDCAGEHFFSFSHTYGKALLGDNVIPKDLAAVSTPAVYFGNAFFLQGVFVPPAGTNAPLWSLSYEFWYYLAFPGLLLTFLPQVPFRTRAKSVLVMALAWFAFLRGGFATYFVIWLMGVTAYFFGRQIRFSRGQGGLLVFACGVLAAALVASRFGEFPYLDYAIGIASALLCFSVLQSPGVIRGSVARVSGFLSSFSYTLYLTHLPFLVFLRAWLVNVPRWQPDALHLLFGAGLCFCATVWTYLVYRVTESHTPWARRCLLRCFGLVPPSSGSLTASESAKAA